VLFIALGMFWCPINAHAAQVGRRPIASRPLRAMNLSPVSVYFLAPEARHTPRAASRCCRISQTGNPDPYTDDHPDNETGDNSVIDRTKSARQRQFAPMHPAEIMEDPAGEQSEKDKSENNNNRRGKTCYESIENYSNYTWGAVIGGGHSSVNIEPNLIQVKIP
jgi:hypothetical protein